MDKQKLIILQLPFSESNEKFTKSLIKKLVIFTNNKCKFKSVSNIRNIRSPFRIKDNVKYYRCLIYKGNCLCDENYVVKSMRNVVLRWAEHKDSNKPSELAKHLKYFPENHSEWKVLARASEYTRKRKTLEAPPVLFIIKHLFLVHC